MPSARAGGCVTCDGSMGPLGWVSDLTGGTVAASHVRSRRGGPASGRLLARHHRLLLPGARWRRDHRILLLARLLQRLVGAGAGRLLARRELCEGLQEVAGGRGRRHAPETA